MVSRFGTTLILAMALCFGTGCVSKSSTTQGSSESFSDSSSSPFEWSSSSSDSSPDDDKTESAYERDVRDYTASYATSTGDVRGLQRDLAAIAEEYGVTDWERHDATYVAIGRGLARAASDPGRTESLAVELANQDHRRLELMRVAYETSRNR